MKSITRSLLSATLSVLVALPLGAMAVPLEKVTICHATSSEVMPYVTIHVSANAIGGHFDNNGTQLAGHEDDLLLQGEVECPTNGGDGGGDESHKVTICHATMSETNPYVRIVVDEHAINGHFENNGTPLAGHEDDILLEGEVDCPDTGPGGGGNNPTIGGLVLIKEVINNDDGTAIASDFQLHVLASTSLDVSNSPAAGSSGRTYMLAPGVYTITEATSTAYARTFAGDCTADGTITISAGATSTCRVINNDIASTTPGGDQSGTLIVRKIVVNDDGGVATSSDFTLAVRSATTSAHVTNSPFAGSFAGVTFALAVGTYTVSETASSTYSGTFSGACSTSGDVSITAGATSTCVITNNDIASSTATSTPGNGGFNTGGGTLTGDVVAPGGVGGGGGSPSGGGNGPIVGSLSNDNGPVQSGGLPGQVLGASTSVIPEGVGGFVPGVPNTGGGSGALTVLLLLSTLAVAVLALQMRRRI